jgi:hypothetical protein
MMVELSKEERAALIDLLVGIIEHDLFPFSRRTQLLRSILAKVRPTPELPPEEPGEIDDVPDI